MCKLLFEHKTDRTVNTEYYLWKIEIKDYNVMIDVIRLPKQKKQANSKWKVMDLGK